MERTSLIWYCAALVTIAPSPSPESLTALPRDALETEQGTRAPARLPGQIPPETRKVLPPCAKVRQAEIAAARESKVTKVTKVSSGSGLSARGLLRLDGREQLTRG
jgi:hypothetical protein